MPYQKYDYNWNGYGADPFSIHLIAVVKSIIYNIYPQPDLLFPTADDSIQIEYYDKNDKYLELEIFETKVEVFQIVNNKEENKVYPFVNTNTELINNINKDIKNFYSLKKEGI